MDAALKRIGKVETVSMPGESAFVKPYSIQYEMARLPQLHLPPVAT